MSQRTYSDEAIGPPYLDGQNGEGYGNYHHPNAYRNEQTEASGDCPDVGSCIDRIGEDETDYGRIQEPFGIMSFEDPPRGRARRP